MTRRAASRRGATELRKRLSAIVVRAPREGKHGIAGQRLAAVVVAGGRQRQARDTRQRLAAVVVRTAAGDGGAARAFQFSPQGAQAQLGRPRGLPRGQKRQRSARHQVNRFMRRAPELLRGVRCGVDGGWCHQGCSPAGGAAGRGAAPAPAPERPPPAARAPQAVAERDC